MKNFYSFRWKNGICNVKLTIFLSKVGIIAKFQNF